MHSASLNPTQEIPREAEWARLIPGGMSGLQGKKKKPQPVRTVLPETISEASAGISPSEQSNAIRLLVPKPLLGRFGWRWLRAVAADFSLVGLNWLLIGALLIPLRKGFPGVWLFKYAEGSPASLLGIAALQAALITLMGYPEGLYSGGTDLGAQVRILGKSVGWATMLLGFAYLMQGAPWPRSVLIVGAGIAHFGALVAWRWEQGSRPGSEQSRALRNVLIVGVGGVARRIGSYLDAHPEAGRVVYGYLDEERNRGSRVVGRVADLARLARTGFVDEVILAAPTDKVLTMHVVREAQRLRLDVAIVPELFGCRPVGRSVEHVDDLPVICVHEERLPAASLAMKRALDVMGSICILTVLSPLLAIVAALIKLDSRGPVIYRAPRAGRKGHLFRCYKFRTMVSNAEELKNSLRQNNERSGPFFKLAEDPRITRVGRILRRYSLDELPQLWNVVKGDMSLVGPRPHPVDDYAAYEIEHFARLDVTPGITGLWQVTARRDPSFQRGMELDREYIHSWSLGSDIRILMKTLLEVLRGGGE